jgi:hypothetical protein
MQAYVRRPMYQRCLLVAGAPRIDFNGNIAGDVTAEQAAVLANPTFVVGPSQGSP